jgi:autotransporter-associated beta strand protein
MKMSVFSIGLAFGLLFLLAGRVQAVEKIFSVNNGNLNAAGSWSPSGVPGAGDTGIIGGGGTITTAVFNANLAGPPDAIIVRTNGAIALSANMTTEHNIILAGGILRYGSGSYTFGSTISLSNESRFLTTSGYNLSFTGLIQNAGAEAGRLIITNSSTNLTFTITIRVARNTYSGGTVLCPGTLVISSTDALGTGPVELNPGAILNWGANISLASRIIAKGGRLQVSANYSLRCTNSVRDDLEVFSSAATPSLGGLIEDYSASETGRLVKTGSGSISLLNLNTFSGGTLVKEGTLIVNAVDKALGKGNVIVTNGAEITLYNVAEPSWPGAEIIILSNASVRFSAFPGTLYTTNVIVREGGHFKGNAAVGGYSIYDRVRIEGRVFLNRYLSQAGSHTWAGLFRDGDVPGTLVLTGTGTGSTFIASANTYTGGTEIEDGGVNAFPLKLSGSGRMPDVGQILIQTNGVMDFNNIGDTVGGLAGVGRVNLGKAVVTVNEGVSPGTNSWQPGLLTVVATSSLARITLASTATNLFHLRTPGFQDQVILQGPVGLTLTGAIEIAGTPLISSGTYTLFDLNGGSLRGTIPSLTLPPLCSGTLNTNSGDVVLQLKVPEKGTIMMLR